jgi:predicted nucleotidyltransferase
MQPDSQVVDRMIQTVVASVRPLRIILFGSAARGEMGPDCDLDLLVVMPQGTHRRKTAQRLYRQMAGLGRAFRYPGGYARGLGITSQQPRLDLPDDLTRRDGSLCCLRPLCRAAQPISCAMPIAT